MLDIYKCYLDIIPIIIQRIYLDVILIAFNNNNIYNETQYYLLGDVFWFGTAGINIDAARC